MPLHLLYFKTMGAGAPKENKNAERWTLEEATKVFDKAVELANTMQYDFLGEIAREQELYIEIYDYLSDKFPELKPYQTRLKRLCEANCFSNGKTGKIVASLAIMNLKSNHGWTDRNDVTSQGDKISIPIMSYDPLEDDATDNGST